MTLHNLSNMMEKQLKSLILDTANNNPAPKWCTIQSISSDHCYANVSIGGGQLNGIECFGYPVVGSKAVMVFMEGDINSPVVLCNPMTMTKYEGTLKDFLNKLPNGGFNKIENNKFKNWNGGTICKTNPLIGSTCCEIKPKSQITSDLVDVTPLFSKYCDNEDKIIQVSMNWREAPLTVSCFNEKNEVLNILPIGAKETTIQLPAVAEWSYQQEFLDFDNVQKLKIVFKNESNQSSFIDGIRVWSMDNSQEWYPYDNNEVGLD